MFALGFGPAIIPPPPKPLPPRPQHTAFMALTLLSELNSVCHLARKLLGTAAIGSGGGSSAAAMGAAAALAAADRVTFVVFRCARRGWLDLGC